MKLEQSLSDLWQCHVWKHLFYINESLSHSRRFIIQSFWWIHPSSFRPHTIAESPQSPLSSAVSPRWGLGTASSQTFNLRVFFKQLIHLQFRVNEVPGSLQQLVKNKARTKTFLCTDTSHCCSSVVDYLNTEKVIDKSQDLMCCECGIQAGMDTCPGTTGSR